MSNDTVTTNIRWTVTKHLIDLLRDHDLLVGVQIEPGWPGDTLQSEAVWVDELVGDVNIPVFTGGRKERDDKFLIPFEIRVANRASLDDTMARLTELVAALEDVMADDPTLDDTDGLVSAEVGHERMTAAMTREGYLGFAEVVVAIHSRLV